MKHEPYFDIVKVPVLRDDAWAQILGLFGIHPIRMVEQIVMRPDGYERMNRDGAEAFARKTASLLSPPLIP